MKRKRHFLSLIFFLIILPSLSYAQTYEIYTYGSGNFLAMVFNGLKMLIEGGYINSLIKIILIVGLLVGVLSPVMSFLGSRAGVVAPYGPEGFIALIKTGIFSALIVYGLMIPRVRC